MRSVAVTAVCAVAIIAFSVLSLAQNEGPYPRIVIDGRFDDWQSVQDVLYDPVDSEAVFCDFREIRAVADGEAVYLFVRLQHQFGLRAIGGRMMVLVDTDGSAATGWQENGLAGVDLVISSRFRSLVVNGKSEEVQVRFWPKGTPPPVQWAEAVRDLLAGAVGAPTVQFDRTEVRFLRGAPLPPSDGPAFTSERMRIKWVASLGNGEFIDETDVLTVSLPPLRRRGKSDVGSESDPLQRALGTDHRVVTWNLSHRTMREHLDDITRLLQGLDGDILLLNEVSDKASSDEIDRMVDRFPTDVDSQDWNVVFGEGGGDERCLVASRFPLKPVTSLNRLHYPKGVNDAIEVLLAPEPRIEAFDAIGADICAAGAVVQARNARVLAVSLGLQSKGDQATSWQEIARRLQARIVQSAIAAALAKDPIDAIVLGGDFNLVVTDDPLQQIRKGLDFDRNTLSIVEALQLDGLSNATWRSPGSGYPPGRLDYILYSGSTLALQRSFVFDTTDLSNRWLEKYRLQSSDSDEISDHLPIVADFANRKPDSQ